jgi:sulfur transfer protein SufE
MTSKEKILSELKMYNTDDELLYDYIISRKRDLPLISEQNKTHENKISGCLSVVYVNVIKTPDGTVLEGFSDSEIISGILGIIASIVKEDKSPTYSEYEDILNEIKLALSQNRRFGFTSIINKIFH